MENEEYVSCPLIDGENIPEVDCYLTCLVVEKYRKDDVLIDRIKAKKNFREICLNCKYHDLS